MKMLFIMPWFCRPCAIEKHVRLLLQAVKPFGITPVVATMYNDEWNMPYDNNVQIVKIRYTYPKLLPAVIARTIPDLLLTPDLFNFTFRRKAVKQILSEVDIAQIDYIHSVCWPCTSHLIAADIKKVTGKPWIAQFYDPWTDNPYRKIKYSYFKQLDAKNERIVAEQADAITHLTPVTKDIWSERYGSMVDNKQHVLLMTFDKELYDKAKDIPQKKREDKLVISFIGKLFHDRNLDDIVQALLKLKETHHIDIEKTICIRIIGEISKHDRNNIETHNLSGGFDIVGYLPQNQLEQYYFDSDVFLLIESPQKQNVFFSSKLLDYFIYQRPVIGIGPKVGITHDLLCDSNNYYIENGDIDGLVNVLKDLIEGENGSFKFKKNYYQEFSPEKLANNYLTIVNSILK